MRGGCEMKLSPSEMRGRGAVSECELNFSFRVNRYIYIYIYRGIFSNLGYKYITGSGFKKTWTCFGF